MGFRYKSPIIIAGCLGSTFVLSSLNYFRGKSKVGRYWTVDASVISAEKSDKTCPFSNRPSTTVTISQSYNTQQGDQIECNHVCATANRTVVEVKNPDSQHLTWLKPPKNILVIKKVRDEGVQEPFLRLLQWLVLVKDLQVLVEDALLDDSALVSDKNFQQIRSKINFFNQNDDLTDKVDFIICLGGDGTLLYASGLFQEIVPPVLAFNLGSLGFLTPINFENFQEQVNMVLKGDAKLTLRTRLTCSFSSGSSEHQINAAAVENIENVRDSTKNLDSPGTKIFRVLNEVVVDRGHSPYLSNIDLYIDGKFVTVVQGDGLIISTPTGSTAYAVAAGASMIHPSVPAIMITPICPHSLSFRPVVVPAGCELTIKLSTESRNSAWLFFDGGTNSQELQQGDILTVTTSIYPVPSVCARDQLEDWFFSLAECLQWNVRKRQKMLVPKDKATILKN